MYKLCAFFLVTRHLICLIPCRISFRMYFPCFPPTLLFPCYRRLPYLLYGCTIIHLHQISKPLELLFLCFPRYWFCFQFLSHHFVSYSVLLEIVLVFREQFISATRILLLMSFFSTQISVLYTRIGQKKVSFVQILFRICGTASVAVEELSHFSTRRLSREGPESSEEGFTIS